MVQKLKPLKCVLFCLTKLCVLFCKIKQRCTYIISWPFLHKRWHTVYTVCVLLFHWNALHHYPFIDAPLNPPPLALPGDHGAGFCHLPPGMMFSFVN